MHQEQLSEDDFLRKEMMQHQPQPQPPKSHHKDQFFLESPKQ